MEHLAPLLGMAGQLAILDRTEAITLDVIHDAAQYLDLLAADENGPYRWGPAPRTARSSSSPEHCGTPIVNFIR